MNKIRYFNDRQGNPLPYLLLDTQDREVRFSENGKVTMVMGTERERRFVSLKGRWRPSRHIRTWLEACQIDYRLLLDSTVEPYRWWLGFETMAQLTLFKTRWGGQ